MCGRYGLALSGDEVADLLQLELGLSLEARYNIAPGQQAPVVRLNQQGQRRMHPITWGLIPSWSRDPGIGNKLMAIVMAFHMALMSGRRLVVSDWPPRTLDTAYPLEELLLPSACQRLFDADRKRPAVKKCTVVACPLRVASSFSGQSVSSSG